MTADLIAELREAEETSDASPGQSHISDTEFKRLVIKALLAILDSGKP